MISLGLGVIGMASDCRAVVLPLFALHLARMDARTHGYPFHRSEKYPRSLVVDFRKVRTMASL